MPRKSSVCPNDKLSEIKTALIGSDRTVAFAKRFRLSPLGLDPTRR